MNDRQELTARISHALGGRRLVWFGIRGEDAASYLTVPEFKESYAITARLTAGSLRASVSLEQSTSLRVDLDRYDIDLDDRPEVGAFRQQLLASLRHPSAVVTYRPSHFLSAICFASLDTSQYLGMFKDRQAAFEHKPWVETELRRRGVPVIPWTYVADERRDVARRLLTSSPLVLRPSRSSGGEGITIVRDPGDLDRSWPARPDHMVSIAPFYENALPVNVGACVFESGAVTVHPASVQLIGLPPCTNLPLGYCGNDFATASLLPERVLDEISEITVDVGRWLASERYIGAFGLDLLIDADTVLVTEINPRFQGSSAMSAELAAEAGAPDIFLDALAAHLGLEPVATLTLGAWSNMVPERSQIIVHNVTADRRAEGLDTSTWRRGRVTLADDDNGRMSYEPGAVLARLTADCRVTETGFDLFEAIRRDLDAVTSSAMRGDTA